MGALQILNQSRPAGNRAPVDAVELSAQLLAEARAVGSPERRGDLDALSGLLRRIDPASIEGDAARLAFWLNLYNALVAHRLRLRPVRGSILWHLRLFSTAAYDVGGHPYTPNVIEHGLLRGNRRPPYRSRPLLRGSDPRLAAAPSRPDPRIHFALNCGARSCPPIRAYAADSVEVQLDLATRAYLEAGSTIDPDRGRVRLPRLLRLYSHDFGGSRGQLDFAARYLPALAACREPGGRRPRVRYARFDWTAAV